MAIGRMFRLPVIIISGHLSFILSPPGWVSYREINRNGQILTRLMLRPESYERWRPRGANVIWGGIPRQPWWMAIAKSSLLEFQINLRVIFGYFICNCHKLVVRWEMWWILAKHVRFVPNHWKDCTLLAFNVTCVCQGFDYRFGEDIFGLEILTSFKFNSINIKKTVVIEVAHCNQR